MSFNNSLEITKFLDFIEKVNKNGFIPNSMKKNDKYMIHDSRDAAIMICSLVYLVNIDKLSFTKVIAVLLHYLDFVYKTTNDIKFPDKFYNENGKPIQNSSDKLENDFISIQLIAICKTVELFDRNNSFNLLNSIHIDILIKRFITFISVIYNKPCFDMWGIKFGIHYNNVKLHELALLSAKNYIDKYFYDDLDVDKIIEDIRIQLSKFTKCLLDKNYSHVIIPTLSEDTFFNATYFVLNSSVFYPFLPIFGYSNEVSKSPELINTAIIILINNCKLNNNDLSKDNIGFNFSYITKYNEFDLPDYFCTYSTLATYNTLICMDNLIKHYSMLSEWEKSTINSLKKKLSDNLSSLHRKLKTNMSNDISSDSLRPVGEANSNMIRLLYVSVIENIKNNEEYKSFSSKDLIRDSLFNNDKDSIIDMPIITFFNKSIGTLTDKLEDEMLFKKGDESESILKKKTDDKLDLIKEKTEEIKYCSCIKNIFNFQIKAPKEVSIENLIYLAEKYYCYDCDLKKNIKIDPKIQHLDFDKISKIRNPLKKLLNMRGLDDIKDVLLDNVIYLLLNGKKNEFQHIAIMGPPGVGKTVIANIMAELYKNLNVLPKGHIVKVSRPDLIGKYLGHTAHKTREAIDKAKGGILFIDEAYSLVDKQGKDSFAKECMDTLVQWLSEECSDTMCIVAGYKEDMEEHFFRMNAGLERRFPFKFYINGYKYDELFEIFCDKMIENKWNVETKDKDEFLKVFKDEYKKFKNFGGDIENLVYRYGLVYNRENFFINNNSKDIDIKLFNKALKHLFQNQNEEDEYFKKQLMNTLYC